MLVALHKTYKITTCFLSLGLCCLYCPNLSHLQFKYFLWLSVMRTNNPVSGSNGNLSRASTNMSVRSENEAPREVKGINIEFN